MLVCRSSGGTVSNETRLDEAIVTAVRRIIRAVDLHSRDLLQNFGLTAPQLMTLRELARLEPVPVGVLSAAVHVSQATMTGILDRLEQRGLVQRTRDGDHHHDAGRRQGAQESPFAVAGQVPRGTGASQGVRADEHA
jgi:DNA-binding transcriptional ArsR family regulator